jgi:hypothetical protein
MKMIAGLFCILLCACSANIAFNSIGTPLQPRFVDNSDGTFTDTLTRLTWTKDDNTPGPSNCWPGSLKNMWFADFYLDCLNKAGYLGHNNWRLPTHIELESLLCTPEVKNRTILKSQVCASLRHHDYWSNVDLAIFIYMGGLMIYNLRGSIYTYNQSYSYPVWPVRSDNHAVPEKAGFNPGFRRESLTE